MPLWDTAERAAGRQPPRPPHFVPAQPRWLWPFQRVQAVEPAPSPHRLRLGPPGPPPGALTRKILLIHRRRTDRPRRILTAMTDGFDTHAHQIPNLSLSVSPEKRTKRHQDLPQVLEVCGSSLKLFLERRAAIGCCTWIGSGKRRVPSNTRQTPISHRMLTNGYYIHSPIPESGRSTGRDFRR